QSDSESHLYSTVWTQLAQLRVKCRRRWANNELTTEIEQQGIHMGKQRFKCRARRGLESGQAMLFTVLGLGIFLIGAMAFAIDFSNIWFNRQSAQTAADAACTAGAMDLLVDATNGTNTQGGFTANTAFGCNATDSNPKPASSPCQYAALN